MPVSSSSSVPASRTSTLPVLMPSRTWNSRPALAHLLGQLVEGGAELGGRPHGPQGVVLVQVGDAEGGHEAVAVALADAGPAVAEGPADWP